MRPITLLCCALSALTVLAVSPLKAQALGPTDIGSLAVLLGDDSIRDSLRLTASQRDQLNTLRTSFKSDARQLVRNTPANASAADLAKANAALTAMLKNSNRAAYHVLNPQQQSELVKIEAKTLGGTILLSTPIQKRLGLTDAQKAKIGTIHAAMQVYSSKIQTLYQKGNIGHFQKISLLHQGRIREADKLLNVLTPDQRATFEKLKG